MLYIQFRSFDRGVDKKLIATSEVADFKILDKTN